MNDLIAVLLAKSQMHQHFAATSLTKGDESGYNRQATAAVGAMDEALQLARGGKTGLTNLAECDKAVMVGQRIAMDKMVEDNLFLRIKIQEAISLSTPRYSIPSRAINCLTYAAVGHYANDHKIIFIGDLCHVSLPELLKTPNMGPKMAALIVKLLSEYGLTLGMDIPGWCNFKLELLEKEHA